MSTEYENDIPRDLAQSAHSGTSFVPERRAEQERQGYAATLHSDYESLSKLATTDEKRATLEEEFARYRAGYAQRFRAYLSAKSRCMSTMIAGPSNFPTSPNQKRWSSADRRGDELSQFRERALTAIRKTLTPELAPIMAGDSDAVTRLEAKIAAAEKGQQIMTAANKIVRQAPKNQSTPEKLAQLVALGIKEANAGELFVGDFVGRLGFPDYALTNNGANIRRMKARLQQISRAKALPETVQERSAARLEDCPADNRVRLFFPGKPEEAIRSELKSRGFRWTPSLGCWQAYRNTGTLETAARIAGAKKEE